MNEDDLIKLKFLLAKAMRADKDVANSIKYARALSITCDNLDNYESI